MESQLEKELKLFWTYERRKKYEIAMNKVLKVIEDFDHEYYEKNATHLIRFTEKSKDLLAFFSICAIIYSTL